MKFRETIKAAAKRGFGLDSKEDTETISGSGRANQAYEPYRASQSYEPTRASQAYEPYRTNQSTPQAGVYSQGTPSRKITQPPPSTVRSSNWDSTIPSTSSSCQTCSRIALVLKNPGQTVPLGTLGEISAISCKWHKPIFDFAISQKPPFVTAQDVNKEPIQATSGNASWQSGLRISGSLAYTNATFDVLHVPRHSKAMVHIRELGDWIETKHVLQAINSCKCLSGLNAKPPGAFCPKFLIDVSSMCLKPAIAKDDYVALSYVWGEVSTFTTIKSNVNQLLKPGGFLRFQSQIPSTVLDAICLARELKVRYIWIDALCIIQDDDKTKSTEILHMAEIYENASFTIIAANGQDAGYGLRGLEKAFKPQLRQASRRKFQLADGTVLIERYGLDSLDKTKWKSRGWTFQEDMFSKRHLIFVEDKVEWACPCSFWRENQLSVSPSDGGTLQTKHKIFSNPWPDLWYVTTVIQRYQKTQLKFPEDIEHAFSGIATKFSDAFVGGFNYGIPLQFFDLAILWSAYFNTCSQRIPIKKESKPLPTWSWMGWVTELDNSYAHLPLPLAVGSFYDPPKTAVWLQLVPLVKWHMITDDGQIPIESNWCQYIKCAASSDEKVPAGWHRHFDAKLKEAYFTHDRLPDINFRYPVPLKSPKEKTKLLPNIPLVGCRSQRNFFYTNDFDLVNNRRAYYTRRRTHAGYFKLLTFKEEPNPDGTLKPIEVVVVSKSTLTHAEFNRKWQIRINQTPTEWERTTLLIFFNVLLVDWKDGIASRIGIGVVFDHAWQEQIKEAKWIDLVLG